MPVSPPPKAAAGGGGAGAQGGGAVALKLPRLPPVQPTSEYSTLRFTRQQPSARLKSWDLRTAVPDLLLPFAVPVPPPGPPPSARAAQPSPRGAQLVQRAVSTQAYPRTAHRSRRDVQGGSSGMLSATLPPTLSASPRRDLSSELFSLDQQELDGFRLGTFAAAAPAAGARSAGAGGAGQRGGPPGPDKPGEEDGQAKQVDLIPTHLLHIRQMYAKQVEGARSADLEKEGEGEGQDLQYLSDASLGGEAGGAARGGPESGVGGDGANAEAIDSGAEEPGVPEIAVQEDFDEDALLRKELARLRTGEDVIAFFAKNGSNTPIKFVYCKRREVQSETEFRPYDLEVIQEMMETSKGTTYAPSMLGEHFTISATGVVYVCPGQQSEYMMLGEWMHECLMYSVLTSMNFFKLYIHRKVFGRWRLHTRYTVYCHHRGRLAQHLFIAKPMFVDRLVGIHSLMHEVESVKVMSIGSNCYNLAEFSRDQHTVRSSAANGAARELEQRHDATVNVLDWLVRTISQSTELSQLTDEVSGGRKKMKSMAQEKKEARDNARRYRLAKHDQSMLSDCIRLVDYMLQACLVKVVVHATMDFFQRIESSSKMFSISVTFGEQSMAFDPGLGDFVDMLSTLWKETIKVVNSVPSFLSVRQYEQYVTSQNNQTVESILLHNNAYRRYTAAIQDKIQSDIAAAQRFSDKNFALFRRIHEYGLQWNEDEYSAAQHTHEDLARDMFLMREFQEDLDNFKPHHNVGIILVDGKHLRASLTPIPERGLTAMKKGLTEVARKKCLVVLERFDSANKILDNRPKALGAFADYVKNYNEIRATEAEMDEQREEVESMYGLLKTYNVRIAGEDEYQMQLLNTKGNDFTHRRVIDAHSYIKEKRDDMIENLGSMSTRIEEDARELIEQLKRGQFVSEDAILNPEVVLEELATVQVSLSRLEEKSSNYTEYQTLFGVPQSFEFAEVEKAKSLFADKHKLWSLVNEWTESKKQWTTTEFHKLNAELCNKQVIEFSKTAFQLTRSLEGDMVAAKIRAVIDEWKGHMPCIMDLGNPAMKERHRAKLRHAIGMGSSTLTLLSLTNHYIFDFKELVAELSHTASAEFALEQQLERMAGTWEELTLPVTNHRNQRDLWILGDVQDVIAQLEDHSVQVQEMVGSSFVRGVKKEVETWEQKIRLASDVMGDWVKLQQAWMHLESMFSVDDIQRQLPAESTKFKGVDKFWKDTMKKARSSSYKTAMEAFHIPKLLPGMKSTLSTVDQIQKSLEEYLETKRAAFPRFYFLSSA